MAKWEKEKPRVRQTTCEIQKSLSNTGIGNFFFLKKMGQPRPLFHLFSSFQTNIIRIFTTNKCVKKCPSSIQCWDLNPQPSGHESVPITTRPGLILPHLVEYFKRQLWRCIENVKLVKILV